MRKSLTTLTVAALGAMGGSNASAYVTFLGEDGNGSSIARAFLDNSLNAQSAFLSAVNNLAEKRVETLETQPVGTPPGGSLSLTFGGGNRVVNATLSGADGRIEEVLSTANPTRGRYSVPDGSRFWEANASANASAFTISFDQDVEAFGFFGVDFSDFSGTAELEFLDRNGSVVRTQSMASGLPSGATDGSVLYFGIVAASEAEFFRTIRFNLSNPGTAIDAFGFDGFTVVGAERATPAPTPGPTPAPTPAPTTPPGPTPPPNQVPEPGTLALTGLALLFMRAARRRRT